MRAKNLNTAWCILFLRNGGERIRAIKLAMDIFQISLPQARDWVDNLKLVRTKIDMSLQRKIQEEYPSSYNPEISDEVQLSASHWPKK